MIDEEVKRFIDESFARAKEILMSHIDKLHILAKRLLEKEKVSAEEFEALMKNEPEAVNG